MNAADQTNAHKQSSTSDGAHGATSENDLITIVSEVEKQIQRIRQMQEAHERDLHAIEQRATELDAAQAELTQRAHELEERSNAITAERAALDEQAAAFDQQRQVADQAHAKRKAALQDQADDLESRKHELDDVQRRLRQQTKSLKSQQADLEEKQQQIEAERGTMTEQSEQMARDRKAFEKQIATLERSAASLEQQVEQLRDELDEKNAKIEEADAALDTKRCELEYAAEQRASLESQLHQATTDAERLRHDLEDVQRRLSMRDEELAETQRKLARANEKLTELSGTLEEQAPLLERGAAAMVKVQHQQRDIERLTDELTQLRASSDFAEVTRKDERLKELTDALRQARGQVAPDDEFARRDARIAELHDQLEQTRVELQRARLEAEQAVHRAAEAGGEEDAELASTIAERDATIAQLSGEAKLLREQLQTLHAQASQASESDPEVALLREQVQTLQSELDDARQAASTAAAASPDGTVQLELQRELEEKTAMLREAAAHLRRRRKRLGQLRRALQSRRSKVTDTSSGITVTEEQLQRLNEEAQMLEDTRTALATSEKEMVRRWARTRAVVVLGWAAFLAVVCGAASWIAADHFYPAVVAGNVELEAKVPPGLTIEPEALMAWSENHIALLEDERFHEAVARRMAERRVDRFRSAARVRDLIASNVTAEVPRPGAVMLTMNGAPADEVLLALDTLAVTLAAESGRQLARAASDPRPTIVGERHERGRVAYASLQSTPIEDNRLMYAGIIFGGGSIILTALILLAYRRLLRSKRIFDAERPDVDFA